MNSADASKTACPARKSSNWLNTQPDVREILDAQFAGRPISEQNLSDWKQSGHLEWLRRQEAREAALRLVERADDLDETDAGITTSATGLPPCWRRK